tara:strand:- start:300 stop:824 length:525 start_codon:yes stop_codon:yes gene_type:complete
MALVWSHINTTEITSSVSSVDLSLSGGFSVYQLVADGLTTSASGANVWLRVSTDGGSTFVSGAGAYYWGGRYRFVAVSSSGASNRGVSGGDTKIILAEAISPTDTISLSYYLHGAKTSSQRFNVGGRYTGTAADYLQQATYSGSYDTAATITDIQILPSSETFDTGTIRLYGVV